MATDVFIFGCQQQLHYTKRFVLVLEIFKVLHDIYEIFALHFYFLHAYFCFNEHPRKGPQRA